MSKRLPAFFLLLLMACNSADREAKNGAPTGPERAGGQVNPAEEAALSPIPSPLAPTLAFLQAQDSTFDPDRFATTGIESADSLFSQQQSEESLRPFRPYLIYNGDSTLALDLYSYNVLLSQKDGKDVGEPGEPDSEVALIDLRRMTRTRLLFGGPSMAVLDGAWTGPQTVQVVAADMIDLQRGIPYVFIFDLRKGEKRILEYPEAIALRPSLYTAGRLQVK
jgi:hypothetical protein